jgi:hypothetical protein
MSLVKPLSGAFAAAMLLALAAPAAAQTQAASGSNGTDAAPLGIGFGSTAVDEKTKTKREEAERAYKDAIKKTPAAQTTANNDPWANMRGADEQKPAAKPAARTAQKKKPAAH